MTRWFALLGFAVGLVAMWASAPSANGPVQSSVPCPPAGLPASADGAGRAMWLWDSPALLDSSVARQKLFDLCRCERIDTVWMQIAVRPGEAGGGLQRAGDWQALLREAHAAGLKVEALDGSPTLALRRFHPIALAAIDAVLAYNKGVEPGARFDGFHYDIEPYLLYRWRFPEHRERIVSEFLDVVLEAHRRLHTQPGLLFGVAVPFWWHREDEVTGQPFSAVTLNGVRKPATFHLIDRLDYVAVMSYRDRAAGPNGLVAITRDLLEYADAVGPRKLYPGVETASGSARVWFVTGLPREAALARMRANDDDPDVLDPIGGYTRELFDDGVRLHMGVRIPPGEPLDSPGVADALRRIAERYAAPSDERGAGATMAGEAQAIATLKKDVEWRDITARPVPSPGGPAWSGFTGTRVTPPNVTFAGQPAGDLRHELTSAQASFAAHRSFAGLAIHDYKHFLELLHRN